MRQPLPSQTPPNIEELLLHGFAPGDRHEIGAAVERELARLFAEQGITPSLMNGEEIAHLNGGSFAVAHGLKPEVMRYAVAQSVYGGMKG